ncbi:MAG: hypothetical protein HYV09_24805 [Deltaproteobacteria bacterium]|nr:hypothetical protein [Deltaproteobacteria bacterium]
MPWYDEIFRFVAHGRRPDGALDECKLDRDGNLCVALSTPKYPERSWDDPTDFAPERVVLPKPGTLWSFFGVADSAGYLLVFDSAVVPEDGATALFIVPMWPGWAIDLRIPQDRGREFKNGISWAVSASYPQLKRDPSGRAWVNAERSPAA